jgi:hypothetical protein
MGAPDPDIVARFAHGAAASSTGALAAHLAAACGHVIVDERVIRQGYRFHAEISDDIPAFFLRRWKIGSTGVAVSLHGGIDPHVEAPMRMGAETATGWSVDPFSECASTHDAREIIEADGYHASVWLARITVGVDLLDVSEIAAPTFIARHPAVFRSLAEELVAVGALHAGVCPLCADGD